MLSRKWEDELYDSLASRCEAGSPDLAIDHLAKCWSSSKELWGGTGHFHVIHKGFQRVAEELKKEYKLEFDL